MAPRGRSRPGSRRSSSRAGRAATQRSWRRAIRPGWPWCSPRGATSATDQKACNGFDIHRTVARVEAERHPMREPHHPPREELELPSVLHALSDPARLEIVRRLAVGTEEWSCGRFELGLSKATLSHHFRVLREAGVVRTRPDGRKRLLSLRSDDLNARFPGLLDAVLTGERPHAVPPVLAAASASVAAQAAAVTQLRPAP